MENNQIKALIVENEALIADEIRRSLVNLGYGITDICYDYDTAAALLPHTDADIVLLDINLEDEEDRTGIELAYLLNATNPRPFIFLTSYSDVETVQQAAATQPSSYLIKPSNLQTLFATIQVALARVQDPELVPHSAKEQPSFFYTKVGKRKIKVYWKDIMYLEATKNYVLLFVKNQEGIMGRPIPLRGTLTVVLNQLIPEDLRTLFYRLNRSWALNKLHITLFNEVEITCGDQVFENQGRVTEAMFREWIEQGHVSNRFDWL